MFAHRSNHEAWGDLENQLYIAGLHAVFNELGTSNRRNRLYSLAAIYRHVHPNECQCAILIRLKHQIIPKHSWSSPAINGRHSNLPTVTQWNRPVVHLRCLRQRRDGGPGGG